MLDLDDIQKLSQFFATKEDLKNLLTREEASLQFNKILTGLDRIIGELKAFRETVSSSIRT